jgi:hypothetical protein
MARLLGPPVLRIAYLARKANTAIRKASSKLTLAVIIVLMAFCARQGRNHLYPLYSQVRQENSAQLAAIVIGQVKIYAHLAPTSLTWDPVYVYNVQLARSVTLQVFQSPPHAPLAHIARKQIAQKSVR